MASSPTLIVLEKSQVSPPSGTIGNRSLQLTFFDFTWLSSNPNDTLLFYELPITKMQFIETIVPCLKNSLSITLQHFFPYVGNLIVYPSRTKKPEIRYVEGDSVTFTSAQYNLDFKDLTGNHPRDCDKFYPLIPQLRCTTKASAFITIPVFSVQVTLFPNSGFVIGITGHHSLADVSTHFLFMKAWTSIAQAGTDEFFIANGTYPVFDRLVNYPKLDEFFLKNAKIETFTEDYQPPSLSGPTNKVRAMFILKQTIINRLKKLVSSQLPNITYLSSFIVACGYIWSCMAELRNDESELFVFAIDCRARMDPPINVAYFGNCIIPCITIVKTTLLKGKEGFFNATKLLGENLHKILKDKDGMINDSLMIDDSSFTNGMPTTTIGVSGSPKMRFYDMDFRWGKPKSYETISIDYGYLISIDSCKESKEDLKIGVSLSATEMEAFVRIFNYGLESYI